MSESLLSDAFLSEKLPVERFDFIASDGGALPCCRHIAGEDLPGQYSLLLFLHGAGSVGNDNLSQMRIPGPPLIRFAQQLQLKIVMLFPQCDKGFQWVDVPWGDDSHSMPQKPSVFMRRALELLDSETARFQPDANRIYAGGISMGGYGAWDLVCRRPQTFAAVLVLCGGGDNKQATHLSHLPAYLLHGAKDTAVPVKRSRDMAEALRQAGNSQVTYSELPDHAHNVWEPCFAEDKAMQWLFSQSKNQPSG